jgi:hypothetical protein
MKKVLYLHGLESSNSCEKVQFLKRRVELVAPSIDYSNESLEEDLMQIVESFKPDLIIGSSMGGYVGLTLANYYNIDSVVFNPALHSRPIEPKIDKLISVDPIFSFTPVVVLGMADDVIDPAKTEDILEQCNFYCDIERVENLGHRIPIDTFNDIYNKYIK